MKKLFCALLCFMSAFAAVLNASAENSISFTDAFSLEQGTGLSIQSEPLFTEDYQGYEILVQAEKADAIAADLAAEPVPYGTGLCSIALTEEEMSYFANRAQILSKGPDDAILLNIGLPCVLREKKLTILLPAEGRGAADEFGNLSGALNYKIYTAPDFLYGSARWSPDGRYLYLNEPERWLGVQMEQDDPYLADTQTGEFFLLETSPKQTAAGTRANCRDIAGGRFSRDGRSFYYILRAYDPDMNSHGILMRYDLETGERETVFESDMPLTDLCEMGDGKWLLLESGEQRQLVRLCIGENETAIAREPMLSFNSCLYPVSDHLAILFLNCNNLCTLIQPIGWEKTGSWLQIQDLSEGGLHSLTADAADSKIRAESRNIREKGIVISASVPDFGRIYALRVIDGTPLVLLNIGLTSTIQSNWPDRQINQYGLMLLNAETLETRVFTDIQNYDIHYLFDGNDEVIYGNGFPGYGGICSPGTAEADADTETILLNYSSADGDYIAKINEDDLVLNPWQVSLNRMALDSTVSREDDRYRVASVFTRIPEAATKIYLLPEAISEDRYRALTSQMKSKEKKQTASIYSLMTPEKVSKDENSEELLAAYPALKTEALYILKDNVRESNLAKIEEFFRNAGYTQEDFELDAANAEKTRGTNAIVLKDQETPNMRPIVTYTLAGAATDPAFDKTRVTQLAGLCDRVHSSVYLKCLQAAGEPMPIESAVPEDCEMDGTVWHITLESAEDNGSTLTLNYTAVPEN